MFSDPSSSYRDVCLCEDRQSARLIWSLALIKDKAVDQYNAAPIGYFKQSSQQWIGHFGGDLRRHPSYRHVCICKHLQTEVQLRSSGG
jgi:hypothetical protein